MVAALRQALAARGLAWAVGVLRTQMVSPTTARVVPRAAAARGRPPFRPVASEPRVAVRAWLAALPARARRRIARRRGTKGPLSARFA